MDIYHLDIHSCMEGRFIFQLNLYLVSSPQACNNNNNNNMRMGYPVCVWANIMSHTRMGVPYKYACMIVHSYTMCTPGINFCLLTKY